jgi:uncharacterized protein YheU (UPF0270 family)
MLNIQHLANEREDRQMAIGNVVQRGQAIYVYDEKGQQIAVLSGGADGTLAGYTSTTVNIKKGQTIYSYNERGQQVAVTHA